MGGKIIFYAGCTCFVAGLVPWLCAVVEALVRIPDRGLGQGLVQAFFVFLVASPFGFAAFFVFAFCLQITSCFKLSTGNVKGWEVTARGPAKPGVCDAASDSRNMSEVSTSAGSSACG